MVLTRWLLSRSWNLVSSSLVGPSSDRLASDAAIEFLKDRFVLNLFGTPQKAFPRATTKSKTDFETKTAAINVTPTPNDKYDITVIKKDALWLSKCMDISEVCALRVVVVEFQARASFHLTGPLSAQDVASIEEAAGLGNSHTVNLLSTLSQTPAKDAELLWDEFQQEGSRRQRLIRTYLSERRHFLTAADYVLSIMPREARPHLVPDGAAKSLPVELVRALGLAGAAPDAGLNLRNPHFGISHYLDFLPGCIKRSEEGLRSAVKDADLLSEELEVDWVRTSLAETVHAMSVVFRHLDMTSDVFISPSIVSKWFEFLDGCAFLDGLSLVSARLSPCHPIILLIPRPGR